MYKLTIVIPIYKVEKYIAECLQSVINQIPPNVQIICINDGSPDKSMDITRNLLKKCTQKIQNQFLLIDQENQGLSEARNKGIKLADGEYIGFLDSDDKLLPNYFDLILNIINNESYDIIDFNIESSNGKTIRTREKNTNNLDSVFRSSKWFSWARIIKKHYYLERKFTPNIYYEDLALMPILYLQTSNTFHISKNLYWYRINEEGITLATDNINNVKTVNSLQTILENYIDLYEDILDPYAYSLIIQTYFLLIINVCRRYNFKEATKYIIKYNKVINNLGFKNKKTLIKSLNPKVYAFYVSPFSYLIMYNIYLKKKYFKH